MGNIGGVVLSSPDLQYRFRKNRFLRSRAFLQHKPFVWVQLHALKTLPRSVFARREPTLRQRHLCLCACPASRYAVWVNFGGVVLPNPVKFRRQKEEDIQRMSSSFWIKRVIATKSGQSLNFAPIITMDEFTNVVSSFGRYCA